MKKINTIICALTVTLLLTTSCKTNQFLASENNQEINMSKESGSSVFVKLKNGKYVFYKTIELKKGVFTAPHLLADGKVKIMPSEIIAYQNHEHFAISQNTFSSGRKSNVAVKTLPGFAVRIVRGKLNVYCKQYFNGRAAIDEFYIQAGTEGKIFVYTPEKMKELIKDNDMALSYFNQSDDWKDDVKKLQNTAELYNNGMFMSKN